MITFQTLADVYAPIRELAAKDGFILVIGVDLDAMTALHSAEELAGRRLFLRWANGPDGKPVTVSVGGCSRGFNAFSEILADVETQETVRDSLWRLFPAADVLNRATKAIREQPSITR